MGGKMPINDRHDPCVMPTPSVYICAKLKKCLLRIEHIEQNGGLYKRVFE